MELTSGEQKIKEYYEKIGVSLFKPSWPDFVAYDRGKKEMLFIEAKAIGDRLSKRQDESFQILTRMGCKIEVAIITVMGEIQRISFRNDRERLKIPGKKHQRRMSKVEKQEKKITQEEAQRRQEEMFKELGEMKKGRIKEGD